MNRNFKIISDLCNFLYLASASRKDRDELKYATWTMVAIVFTYLCCNVFSVFMIVIENLFPESVLLYNKDGSRLAYISYFFRINLSLLSMQNDFKNWSFFSWLLQI